MPLPWSLVGGALLLAARPIVTWTTMVLHRSTRAPFDPDVEIRRQVVGVRVIGAALLVLPVLATLGIGGTG